MIKEKLLNVYKENNKFINIFCLFIIIQPFLDFKPFFENTNFQIFGFTIPTIIRFLFLGLLTIFMLLDLRNKKSYYYIFSYIIILSVYFFIHHKIAIQDMNIPESFSYSLLSEIFYIVRMLLPLIIIFYIKHTKLDYNKFIRTILVSSLIISLVIFIGNTLCISYTSYLSDSGITKINWIFWFTNVPKNYEFAELTSKGWFYMANQVSGLMMVLVPFCAYDMLKRPNKLNIITTFLMIFSMIIIGSRTASYGWLLVSICLFIVLLYLRYIKKEKWWTYNKVLPLICISVIGIILLFFAPINTRNFGYSIGDLSTLDEKPVEINPQNIDKVYKYIKNSYTVYGVQERYVEDLYYYKFDPKFWLDIFDYTSENGVIENRKMQTLISNRIEILNDNDLKYQFFGYSFSRMMNGGIYIEHDFIVQMFTMGYVGAFILLVPYLYIILLVFLKIIKKLKDEPKLIDFVFMIAMCAVLGTSLFTGHILDELFVMIYVGFICGFFLKRTNPDDAKEMNLNEKDEN